MNRLSSSADSSQILSVFRLLKRVGFAILLLTILLDAKADTTWVSGQVGGIWGLSGSPYIIVDSSWVNPQSGLIVESGVEIRIDSMLSCLQLAGTCLFGSVSGDSVYTHFGRNAEAMFSYQNQTTSIRLQKVSTSGDGGFYLEADSCTIQNCSFSNYQTFPDVSGNSVSGNYANIDSCHFESLFIQDATFRVHACTFTGVVSTNYAFGIIDSVIFTGEDTLTLGDISFFPLGGMPAITLINSSCRMVHHTGFIGMATPLQISNTRCYEYALIQYVDDLEIRNSIFKFMSLSRASGLLTTSVIETIDIDDIDTGFLISNSNFLNTDVSWYPAPLAFITISGYGDLEITNNIFVSVHEHWYVLRRFWGDIAATPSYNIVHGMSDPWRSWPLGPGNFSADPLFDPHDSLFALTYSSPAIDVGTPDSNDEDGTRSDIGLAWWDHRYDHPPIITTPDTICFRWGDPVSLTWSAIDEQENIEWEVVGTLPGWVDEGIVPIGAESFDVTLIATDILFQTDIENARIQIRPFSELSGVVRGVLSLEYSPYTVLGDIIVEPGDTLIVEPGVEIQFGSENSSPWLMLEGTLFARGTADDSVQFMRSPTGSWRGIAVQGSSSSLSLTYSLVTDAQTGIFVDSARAFEISNSTLSGFDEDIDINIQDVRDTISLLNSSFSEIELLLVIGSNVEVDSCDFNCIGTSFGLSMISGYLKLTNSQFDHTTAYVINLSDVDAIIERCVLNDCSGFSVIAAGAMNAENMELDIRHCVFRNIAETVISVGVSLPELNLNARISNCVFDGIGEGLVRISGYMDSSTVLFQHNCLSDFDHGVENSVGRHIWVEVGAFDGFNSQGDSIDLYNNVLQVPLLDSISFAPLANSPCIDAGLDYGQPYWGTAPDIGVIEYDPTDTEEPQTAIVTELAVSAFPNPFNPSTNLVYSLPEMSNVEISIYDVLGRLTDSYELGFLTGGMHHMKLDGVKWASGVYFAVLTAGKTSKAIKLMVIK